MQTPMRNVTPVTLTEEDKLFIDTLQSTQLDWQSIHDDASDFFDWEQESPDDDDIDYDFMDDWEYDNELIDDRKQPYARRFRKLRNKAFLPVRRYGNSYDGYEGRRNDNPRMFKARREALAVIRKEELQEPLRAIATHHGSWRTGQARYELRMLGYYFNWRKTIDFDLRRNNLKRHALSEPETDMWAYSENPYGKNGIEPAWRKIGTYTPTEASPIKNEGRVMEVYGIGGGGIRTWRPS